jgi:hypothetical protein
MLSDHKLILANHDESSRKKEILKKLPCLTGVISVAFVIFLRGNRPFSCLDFPVTAYVIGLPSTLIKIISKAHEYCVVS